MDYCEGGDLFKKINSQRGVLFSEDQVSHTHLETVAADPEDMSWRVIFASGCMDTGVRIMLSAAFVCVDLELVCTDLSGTETRA